eukprot:1158218-Pelagomonas_calceolata.AAC.4
MCQLCGSECNGVEHATRAVARCRALTMGHVSFRSIHSNRQGTWKWCPHAVKVLGLSARNDTRKMVRTKLETIENIDDNWVGS